MARNPQRDKDLLKHIFRHIERIKQKRESVKNIEDFVSNEDVQEIIFSTFSKSVKT